MQYKKGERVKHPIKVDWGLGEVLEDSSGDNVSIFFVGAGEKTISLKYVEPIKVEGDEANHPVLNNLKISNTSKGIKYQSLPQSIELFLKIFPEGFYGKKYADEERDYKMKAHNLACELLGNKDLEALLSKSSYGEICIRALRIVNATNLIFPNEKMSLKDGLGMEDRKKLFSETLYQLLYDNADLEERFMRFARALEEIGAAKWTTASYFLFIVFPDKYMFMKPTVTQNAAEVSAFEINYRPKLNWLTYKSVLAFSDYLKSELSELKPRDMIDVQSFMWCIAPGKY
jgi:hypothetical protein